MSKEMFIASSPHETKVAVLEDDQLVEVYFERDTDVGLVGSIYKGRVNRVLPGMQSAFVDIGLERDAFLYVSDFYEDAEEYEKVVAEAEARVTRIAEVAPAPAPAQAQAAETPPAEARETVAPPAGVPEPPIPEQAVAPPPPAETSAPAQPAAEPPAAPQDIPASAQPSSPPPANPSSAQGRGQPPRQNYRGRRHRGRGGFRDRHFARPEPPAGPPPSQSFEVLPGESLAKYSHTAAPSSPAPSPELPPAVSDVSDAFSGSIQDAPSPNAASSEPPASPPVSAEFREQDSIMPERVAPPAGSPTLTPQQATEARGESAEERVQTEPAQGEPVGEQRGEGRPLWHRIVSTVFGESTAKNDLAAEGEPPEQASQAEGGAPGEVDQSPSESSIVESDADAPAEPVPAGQTSDGAKTKGKNAEYTLREPHQRPRFAPRRRRGRRGGRGRREPRGEGGYRREAPRAGNHQPVQITSLLKEGQEIIVQIAKEPLGRKGARITSHIALPGRYLVYMPTVDHIGVSRKISTEEERLRLRNVILENKGSLTGGFIVRTAAEGHSEEELKSDLRYLSTLWSDVRAKAETAKAPAMLHRDLNLVERLLRDLLTPEFKSIRLDQEAEYERVLDFVSHVQPSLVPSVRLYTRDTPMFEEFNVQPEIDKALKPKVWLKSGGYIVINQTEALVAIDVNTGKYVGKTNRLEDTIVKTNIDAVKEIVRQIRLRDLGGIIVIDFIDMDERRNRNRVVQALEEQLRADRAPTKLLAFNDFGLVAITRKRVKQSLERTLCQPCEFCGGGGWVKSVQTICNEIMTEMKKMAKQLEGDVVTLRVNPEVARALKSREGLILSELVSLTKKDVVVKSDSSVHQEQFEIY